MVVVAVIDGIRYTGSSIRITGRKKYLVLSRKHYTLEEIYLLHSMSHRRIHISGDEILLELKFTDEVAVL